MPSELPQRALDEAEAAVAFAIQVRRYHRRRTDRNAKARHDDIDTALARLRAAMKPLRAEIGRFSYGPSTDIAEANRQTIREASQDIQRERRKLHKMKARADSGA